MGRSPIPLLLFASRSMFGFLKKVGDYTRDAVGAAQYMTQGLAVTFDHLRRRPITVQYPTRS